MRLFRSKALLFSCVVSAAFADRTVASVAKAACLDVVAGAPSASGPEDPSPGAWVFQQCQRVRPAADHDCREFVQLYQTARHYGQDKFSADDFCSTVQAAGASAQHLSDHEACVAGVDGAAEALNDKAVIEAAVAACMRAHPRIATTPDSCQRYVAAVVAAPKDGLLDTTSLCNRLLATSASPHNTGNSGDIDEGHFVAPCVQFAANAIATGGTGGEVAAQVQQSCESHLRTGQDFCTGYAALVRRAASNSELNDFCTAQFRKMQQANQPSTLPSSSPPSTASTAAVAVATPVATAVVSRPAVTQVMCEQYLRGVVALKLPLSEVAQVVRMDCPSHLGASASACANVERLVAAGDVPGACRAAVDPEPPAPMPQGGTAAHGTSGGPDMVGACARTVEKVSLAGLHDAALSRAAADVCAQEVGAEIGQQQPGLRAGCEFLAGRLVAATAAQGAGAINAAAFCASLKGGNAQPSTPPSPSASTAAPAPEADAQVVASPSESPRAQLRGATVATTDSQASNVGNGDFLSAFLDHYDEGKEARAKETRQKVKELFGSPDNGGLPPLAPVADVVPQGSPRKQRPNAQLQLESDGDPMLASRRAVQAEPRNDIDSLVASFVSQQAY